MLERLLEHGSGKARARAERRAAELAERIGEKLPRGATACAAAEGVTVAGRGLGRRFALEPALRWLALGLARDRAGRWR
jgi:hypothetical protein